MIYIYDGSYQGFLSVVYANYYQGRADQVLSQDQSPGIFLDQSKEIGTDREKAGRVEKALGQKCGKRVMDQVYYAFHAAHDQKDTYLLRFIERAFRLGERIKNALSEPEVMEVYQLAKGVSRERHTFLGFVRFKEVNYGLKNYLYAGIEPENNILALMGPHFADRFYRERIVLHDTKRKLALVAYQGQWEIRPFMVWPGEIKDHYSATEEEFQNLWQAYFAYIAIDERKSKNRQAQFVPLKYRPNLTEFSSRW